MERRLQNNGLKRFLGIQVGCGDTITDAQIVEASDYEPSTLARLIRGRGPSEAPLVVDMSQANDSHAKAINQSREGGGRVILQFPNRRKFGDVAYILADWVHQADQEIGPDKDKED